MNQDRPLTFRSLLNLPINDEDFWTFDVPNQTGLSVSEDKDQVYIEAYLPGLKAEDIEVTMDRGMLWIRGEKKEEEEDKKKKYYKKAMSSFSYRLRLPDSINEKVEPEATYKDGVMKIAFKKSIASKAKKITVKKKVMVAQAPNAWGSKTIFTIGHSTRSIQDFIFLLKSNRIQTVIDIRSIPWSMYNPQFSQDQLKAQLKKAGIGYQHMKNLGGLRHPKKNSINVGWKNASFRGYADYMQSPPFQKALKMLEEMAREKRCVLLCAEALFWRCHRSLLSDALTVHQWKVFHILGPRKPTPHRLTAFLKIRRGS